MYPVVKDNEECGPSGDIVFLDSEEFDNCIIKPLSKAELNRLTNHRMSDLSKQISDLQKELVSVEKELI